MVQVTRDRRKFPAGKGHMRGWIAFGVLILAGAASTGYGQLERSNPLSELTGIMPILGEIYAMRRTCLSLYPAEAETIERLYESSSVPEYFQLLDFPEAAPAPEGRASEARRRRSRSQEDEDRKACFEDFAAVLASFDLRFAHRTEEMRAASEGALDALANPEPLSAIAERNRLAPSPDAEARLAAVAADAQLSEEGARVRVVHGDSSRDTIDPSCTLLQSSAYVRKTADLAIIGLRNATARLGGNTLLVHDTSARESTVSVAAMLLRCD
jgi:hypothetical protein